MNSLLMKPLCHFKVNVTLSLVNKPVDEHGKQIQEPAYELNNEGEDEVFLFDNEEHCQTILGVLKDIKLWEAFEEEKPHLVSEAQRKAKPLTCNFGVQAISTMKDCEVQSTREIVDDVNTVSADCQTQTN
ncbi:unnamed protein product, partial [Strongylus vulgaris]